MLLKMHQRHGQKGFTLIELLIVVAIIGIIAAILIPNLIDALQKAKQKRTVADMRNIGTAWMSWLTDMVSAGAAGTAVPANNNLVWTNWLDQNIDPQRLADILEGTAADVAGIMGAGQFYLQELQFNDGWGNPFQFGGNFDAASPTTWDELITETRSIGIRSQGRNGDEAFAGFETDDYVAEIFLATNYDEDIVWADGYFVRSPGGISTAEDVTAP